MHECAFFIIFVEILFSHPSAAMGAPSCSPAHLDRRPPSSSHYHIGIGSTPQGSLETTFPVEIVLAFDMQFYNTHDTRTAIYIV